MLAMSGDQVKVVDRERRNFHQRPHVILYAASVAGRVKLVMLNMSVMLAPGYLR